MLRPWPGNVRELLAEVRGAAQLALRSPTRDRWIRARHLADEAGMPLEPRAPSTTAWPDDERIAAALAEAGGNVSQAARSLGLHRTQLRRWMARRDAGS